MTCEHCVEVKDANYETVIGGGLVLIDFWAPWCGPCRTQTPIVENVAEKYSGRITVGTCNVDENSTIASALNIQSIPSLILYIDGEQVERFVGVTPEDTLTEIIDFELE